MRDPLVDVLAERSLKPKGLNRMLAASFGVHVGTLVVALLFSRMWLHAQKEQPKMMTISLAAGAEGPKSTGMTPLGARPVEKATPPPKRPEPIKPIAPKSDAMTIPVKAKPEPPKPEPPKAVEAPKPPVEQPPTTGREVTPGTSRVETNVKTQGTGLATGGSFGNPQDVVIDEKFKFCCQAYIDTMCALIQRNWDPNQHQNGEVILRFTIQRDGKISDITSDKYSSSYLNRQSLNALNTVQMMGGFGKLPDEFKDDKLIVHLRFPYVR